MDVAQYSGKMSAEHWKMKFQIKCAAYDNLKEEIEKGRWFETDPMSNVAATGIKITEDFHLNHDRWINVADQYCQVRMPFFYYLKF